MPETLEALEARREKLYQQLRDLGDFRRGTISVNFRRCGKANCACARADHPGHGPQYLWHATIAGRSCARNLRLGPELQKVNQEVENYRRFVAWSQELVEVNERICEHRPVQEIKDEQELEQLKKKLQKQFAKRWSRN
jgi:hypothetical protein